MKKIYITIFISHALFFLAQWTNATETVLSKTKPTSCFSFENVPLDIKKQILTNLLSLYDISVENICISPRAMTWCFPRINQLCKPLELCQTKLTAIDLALLTPDEKHQVYELAHPSLMRRISGYSSNHLHEDDYEKLHKLPDDIKKKLGTVEVKDNGHRYMRRCTATTCTCGICLCCCGGNPVVRLGAFVCLSIGCAWPCVETFIFCARSCCDKYVNPGFKPQYKTFLEDEDTY